MSISLNVKVSCMNRTKWSVKSMVFKVSLFMYISNCNYFILEHIWFWCYWTLFCCCSNHTLLIYIFSTDILVFDEKYKSNQEGITHIYIRNMAVCLKTSEKELPIA